MQTRNTNTNSSDLHRCVGKTVFRIALMTVAVLGIIGVLFSLGKYIALPPSLSVTVQDASESVQNDACGAIVDESGARVIIRNKQGEVSTILGGNLLFSQTTSYGSIAVQDDSLYVQETEYDSRSGLILHDKVVCYSVNGKAQGTVLDISYDEHADPRNETSILGIFIVDGEGVALVSGDGYGSVAKISFPLGVDDSVTKSDDNQQISLASLPSGEDAYDSYIEPTSGDIYVLGTLGNAFRYDASTDTFENVAIEGHAEQSSLIVASEDGRASIGQVAEEGITISFAPLFALRQVWFWIGLAIVLALFVTFCVRGVVHAAKQHDFSRLKMAVASVGVLIAACAIVALYASEMNNQAVQDRETLLETAVLLTYENDGDAYASTLEEFNDTGACTPSAYQMASSSLQNYLRTLSQTGSMVAFTLFAIDDDNEYAIADSSRSVIVGAKGSASPTALTEILEPDTNVATGTYNNAWGSFTFASYAIRDDAGATIGVLAAYSDAALFSASLLAKQLTLLATLLSVAIAVAFLVSEARMWGKSLEKLRIMTRDGDPHPEVAIARPLFFLSCSGDCVAAMLSVLIARDLLQAAGQANDELLMSLPLLANALGLLAGGALYTALSRRFSRRRTIAITQPLACISYLLAALAVALGSFPLFILFLFAASAFVKPSILFAAALPLRARDEDSCSAANESLATAGISVASLCTLAAGGVSTVFGNASVYVLASVFPLLAMGLVLAKTPNHETAESTTQPRKTTWKALFGFAANPQLIILMVCVIGTLSISQGYKSYLFPLILADNGLTKTDFASVFVICNAIAFFLSPSLSKAGSRLGRRRLAVVSLAVLSVTFFGFLLNTTLAWAVVALAVTLVCGKVGTPCWKTLWPRATDNSDMPKEDSYVLLDAADKGFDTLRGPVWGALATMGQATACVAFAAFCAVTAAVFALTTRKGPFSDKRV